MGACISAIGGTYTFEELNQQLGPQVDTLPRLAKSQYGDNVLELKGMGWFFNPKAPFDSSILCDKLSPQDYSSAISSINTAHLHRLEGTSRIYTPSEIPKRRQMGKEAVQAALQELNRKTVGYHWDLQAGQATTTVTSVNNYGDGGCTTEHKLETSLLLVFDQE